MGIEQRRESMALLARADGVRVAAAWAAFPDKPDYKVLRGPETGLVMVRGRVGGGGKPFNLGEVTVTRATVQLTGGGVGHAYCLGRDADKVVRAAVFDALWQAEETRGAVEREVIEPLRADAASADRTRRDETAATQVDFFTMVRGEDE